MSMDGDQFEKKAIYMLAEILGKVPFLAVGKPVGPCRADGEMFPMDGAIRVQYRRSQRYLILEVKKNAQLRDVKNFVQMQLGIDRIQRFAATLGAPGYGVFASQYLTPATRDYCKEKGVGYFDLSGNCRLVFDEVYIEREVPNTVAPERKRLRSMFSEKSARVMRRLLEKPNNIWRVQSLSELAQVSSATVSLLKERLLGDGYASRDGDGFILAKPETLLLDWANHYGSHEHKQLECYSKGDLNDVEDRFIENCHQMNINYAFTMFAGAKRIAPFTRGVQRAHAYIATDKPLKEIAQELDLKPVESGGNFRLIDPSDVDLLYGTQVIRGAKVVSDIQLYLDLAGHKGRGEENAEFLLENRIKQKW